MLSKEKAFEVFYFLPVMTVVRTILEEFLWDDILEGSIFHSKDWQLSFHISKGHIRILSAKHSYSITDLKLQIKEITRGSFIVGNAIFSDNIAVEKNLKALHFDGERFTICMEHAS